MQRRADSIASSQSPRGLARMVWIPGGEFSMGSDRFYPEERPIRRVAVDGFWMDEHPITVDEFRRFVDATGYVTVAEQPLDPAEYPGRRPEPAHPRLDRLPSVSRPDRSQRQPGLVAVPARRILEATRRPRQHPRRTRRASGRPRRQRRRRGLRELGRQGASDGGRMGVRCPRRTRGRHLRVGRRALPGRPTAGEHLARGVPSAEPRAGRVRRHLPGRQLPAQRLRALRHHRQRLGVDERLVRRAALRQPPRLLHADEPARHDTRGLLQLPRRARRAHPAQGHQGRLASLCARTTAFATARRRANRR